jgi:hypothetical protein
VDAKNPAWLSCVTAISFIMAACSPTTALPSVAASAPISPAATDLPVDPAIAPVSASHPDAAASAALDACSLTDTTGHFGANGPLGIDQISGMGLVAPASDAVKYVGLEGAPELQAPSVWIITISGWLTVPVGISLKDATCVVASGVHTWYATGDSIGADGAIVTPMPLPPRELRLPPLTP